MLHRGFNQFGVTMLSATVACLGYLGFVWLLQAAGVVGGRPRGGLRLGRAVPGPRVPAGHRLPRPGQARLLGGHRAPGHALMILTSAGARAVGAVAGGRSQPGPAGAAAPRPGLAARAAVRRQLPRRARVRAHVQQPVAHRARGGRCRHGGERAAHRARRGVTCPRRPPRRVAALVVGLLAAVVAPRLDVPRITVYVPAVTIMVPGVLAYRAVFHISNGNTVEALAFGVAGRAHRRRAGHRPGHRPHAHRPHVGVRALSDQTCCARWSRA